MTTLEQNGPEWSALADPNGSYVFCANAESNVCNWLISASDRNALCASCKHNRIVPDLAIPDNLLRWQKIELAKRYLFRSLLRWRLPMPDRSENPRSGLVFDLKGDVSKSDGSIEKVQTGHDEGVITLNIIEADDVERESRRASMGETYRTLIGHFRHEIGHYFWDRLIRDKGIFEGFRTIFGDERQNYEEALKRHYAHGAPANWQDGFISSYATSHPWEDFAETWAHYIHIVDALETARSYGINVSAEFKYMAHRVDGKFDPYAAPSIEDLIGAWVPLTVAINGVNRSMGQPDLYPFVLSNPVVAKLRYVHDLLHSANSGH
jgi:hypothetical protein